MVQQSMTLTSAMLLTSAPKAIGTLLAALCFLESHLFVQADNRSPIKVISARRATALIAVGGTSWSSFPNGEVALILEIEGIALEDFEKAEKDENIRVVSGDRTFKLLMSMAGIRAGRPKILMVVPVPRAQLTFRVLIGDLPAQHVTVSKTIFRNVDLHREWMAVYRSSKP